MIVRVLGSAAGGGVPQWNCACENCTRVRRGEVPVRTQSSVAVSPDGQSWVLVNASSDLPRQLAATPELWPAARRATPFCAILLTDANVDHTSGLGELRQEPEPLIVVSTPIVKSLLASERSYERFARPPHRWLEVQPDEIDFAAEISAAMSRQLEICAIDVPGTLPGYAGRKPAQGAVIAYRLRDRATDAAVLVAPVFAEMSERFGELIAQADLALLDGTFFSDDELASHGLMSKTAHELGHFPVGGPHGTLARIESMKSRRVFIHINNSNPMLNPRSAAHAAIVTAGCEIAFDGWSAHLGAKPLGRRAMRSVACKRYDADDDH